jgi:hypothetical protein
MKKSELKKIIKEVLDASTSPTNKVPGGLAQFATVGDLAQMHKIPLDQIIKQILKGIKVESEHTTDLDIAMEIAFDHVYEDPKYYDKLASIEENTLKKKLSTIKYSKPNFENEWEEAVRYPEFEDIGKEEWIKLAAQGKPVAFSKIKDVLGNVDLDVDRLEEPKKKRFEQALGRGVIELPIAVKFGEQDYDLVAGNTRLSGLVKNGIDPIIWTVNSPQVKEGTHDPVEPGILKKRLGKLTCSKVRQERSGLEDKGTHYAKALQRYLNYHCQ